MKPRHAHMAALLLLVACGGEQGAKESKGEIYVSFPPLAQFAKRIVGTAIPVRCPLPGDVDPAAWKPSRDEIALFQSATLVLVHGAELEGWVGKASLPTSRVVDVSRGLSSDFVQIVHPGHAHGAGGEGTHSHVDSHVWMDPTLAKRQAEAILEAVVQRWPELEKDARARFLQLAADFDTLDQRWRALAPKLAAAKHYNASHNFAYLAKRYGFEFKAELHVAPMTAPVPEALAELKKQVEGEGKKLLWWETPPSAEVRQVLSDSFDFVHVVLDSGEAAGLDGSDADYFEAQRKNLDAVEAALSA